MVAVMLIISTAKAMRTSSVLPPFFVEFLNIFFTRVNYQIIAPSALTVIDSVRPFSVSVVVAPVVAPLS